MKPRLSVSTWSLHHALGAPDFTGPQDGHAVAVAAHSGGELSLLDLPARISAFGINTLEICHFHLPARDAEYLSQLRAALEAANVELWSLLIDDGDITSPQNAQRDEAWISDWFPVAQQLGAKNVRVIAGKQATSEQTLKQSIAALQRLAQQAKSRGLRLTTENWFDTLATPASVLQVLDALNGDLGLCLDFGNWSGPDKYDKLRQIAPRAQSCHTKAPFRDGKMDEADFRRCLQITREAGFAGPHTLIYDSGGDEWRGLAAEREMVAEFLV